MNKNVVIIGAGVIGCSVARYLARYNVNITVIEKDEDLCCGTSKANSGIVHAGFDAKPGSLMARMNVEGSKMMPALAKELDIKFKNNGSLVLCFEGDDESLLEELYESGKANGVSGIRLLSCEELHQMEPNVSPKAVKALLAPTGGIICPFGLTIALGENAFTNGAKFIFNTKVKYIHRQDGSWIINTSNGALPADVVVNAAGVYADTFHNMVSRKKIHITPRRGDYNLLDTSAGNFVNHTIFQLPGKYGKGVLISPTVHGNLIVGPTAIDITDKEGTNTTSQGINIVKSKALKTAPNLPVNQVITSFAGLRAHEDNGEFIIGSPDDAKGFFNCAGIESPGLSSSPAIGKYLSEQIKDYLDLSENLSFVGEREGVKATRDMTFDQWNELAKSEPAYGKILCRCNHVTEGEILDAIRRPLGATTLDGIKRRTTAEMGRCQSGFCSPYIIDILSRELGIPVEDVRKSGRNSTIITGRNKDWI